MKIDMEQNQKTLKIEKKKLRSCEFCIMCILIVLLFKVIFIPVPVSSCYNYVRHCIKRFAFCD